MERRTFNHRLAAEARKLNDEGMRPSDITRLFNDRGDKVSRMTVGRYCRDRNHGKNSEPVIINHKAKIHPALMALKI